MNVITSLLSRFARPAVLPPPAVGAFNAAPRDATKLAFEVPADNSTTIQVVFPCRTRQFRIEPEAQVYVLFYRDFGRAIRYVELHGKLRKEFGPKVPMWTLDIEGQRDDALVELSVQDARDVLQALRNPVEVPVIPEGYQGDSQPRASNAPVDISGDALSTLTSSATPLLIREGWYMNAGSMPWRGPDNQLGKASFAVLIRRCSDNEQDRLWGSDLSRVIREADVKLGDRIKLTKYPRTKVMVGNRVVHKNIWTCEVLEKASNAQASTSNE